MVLAFAAVANAQNADVFKVLPQFLDAKGRSALSPSLFDRDAYQVELRANPAKRSALRFNVQWKASYAGALTLRVEAKGGHGKAPTLVTLEQPVQPGSFSRWTPLTLKGESYTNFGELISWRATLLQGTNVVAEQRSFLW